MREGTNKEKKVVQAGKKPYKVIIEQVHYISSITF